jgi:hypothetical protein
VRRSTSFFRSKVRVTYVLSPKNKKEKEKKEKKEKRQADQQHFTKLRSVLKKKKEKKKYN